MIWPWKHRGRDSERKLAAADERKAASEQLAATSRRIHAGLLHQLELNGFSEMLQQAMGGRH